MLVIYVGLFTVQIYFPKITAIAYKRTYGIHFKTSFVVQLKPDEYSGRAFGWQILGFGFGVGHMGYLNPNVIEYKKSLTKVS